MLQTRRLYVSCFDRLPKPHSWGLTSVVVFSQLDQLCSQNCIFSIFVWYHHHHYSHFHNCVSKETNKLRRYLGMNEEKRLMGGGGRLLRVILMKVKVIKVMKAKKRTTSKDKWQTICKELINCHSQNTTHFPFPTTRRGAGEKNTLYDSSKQR